MFDNENFFICAIYIPPDKNVYYRKYDIDVFVVFQQQIEIYSKLGNIAVIGDLSGRVGNEPDYLLQDGLNKKLMNKVDNLIDYIADVPLVNRLTEDLKTPNSFGKHILDLCESAGLRICNGRFGDSRNFTTFSCHAPLVVDIKLKCFYQKTVCTCTKIKYNTIRWNEEFRDEVREDLIHNAQKFEELHKSITEDADAINNAVNEMNAILTNIFEKYNKKLRETDAQTTQSRNSHREDLKDQKKLSKSGRSYLSVMLPQHPLILR
ncbi:Hypothetical predicted protein [Mytilus galloprovincialis]|uniref:Endonuclease/exonuclease/phosphatase domain-containing protein n=1 Tax=Mytilus galloprovincialis TaxID=29158 RepID=A0A8B6FWM4_MYTGA|nr:Hypothetical predicted protein [Mytilus galloprovincialis]